MNSVATDVSEYDAIADVLQQYIDGAKSGKGDDMKPAFHKDATVFGYVGADLFAGPIQILFDWNDQNGAATGLKPRIASIDLIRSVATVRLELENWTGHRFTDLFTLLKVDGEWKIMKQGLPPTCERSNGCLSAFGHLGGGDAMNSDWCGGN